MFARSVQLVLVRAFAAVALLTGALPLVLGAAVQAQESAPTPPPPIEYSMWTLDNGLRVIAVPDSSTSTVTTSLWYEVGSKHDPEGRAGLAHLAEHIASRKTENIPYNLIYSLTADVGGTRNATNWVDRTNYWEQVPAQYLETMLWTHAERMARVVVDEEVLEAERDVVKEELRGRVLGPPYGRLQRIILPENAFDVLPHRRAGIGTLEDINKITLEDVRGFYEAYYGPDTATLIVAGNFDFDKLRVLVDQYFADIPPRANPLPTAIDVREPKRTAPRTINAHAPNVALPAIGGLWKAPAITHKDVPALRVVLALLSGGQNNRLSSALLRTGLAVETSAFAPIFKEGGYIGIYALTAPERLEAAGAAFDQTIEQLRKTRVSAAELAEAKAEIIAETLKRRETARGRAFELGEGLMASGDPDFANRMLEAITKVTPRDVQRAARRYLADKSRVSFTYLLGPGGAETYANPAPMPDFGALPPPTRPLRQVQPAELREPVPGPKGTSTLVIPQMVETRLANGISVIAAKTGNVPIVTLSMVLPGGSKTDPKGQEGVADLAAALAASGFHGMNAEQIAARFESLGASFIGSADADGTTFTLTVPRANLEAAGQLTAQILDGAYYPSKELSRERVRRVQRLSVRRNDPTNLAEDTARKVIYGDAPYASDLAGTEASLGAINRNDLLLYRQRFFQPSRMTVIVSGGIDPAEAVANMKSIFGDWGAYLGRGAIVEGAAGKRMEPRTIVIDIAGADQASVLAALPAPSRANADFDALQLVNAVLGAGSSGRLFQEVRTKRSLAYGAYSRIDARKDGSLLIARALTRNESAGEVARLMLSEIDRLGKGGVDEELLARRRVFLEGSYGRVMERSGGFNAVVSGLVLHGLAPSNAGSVSAQLASVDVAQASRVAAQYLSAEKATLVVVGNADAFLEDLRRVRGDVEVIALSELDLSAMGLRQEPN